MVLFCYRNFSLVSCLLYLLFCISSASSIHSYLVFYARWKYSIYVLYLYLYNRTTKKRTLFCDSFLVEPLKSNCGACLDRVENQTKMALVHGPRQLLNFGIFALQAASKQQKGCFLNLSLVANSLGIKGKGLLRCYSSEKGNILSKLLGRSVSPHTDAHSKVLTESLALYELQCKWKYLY